MVLGELSEVFHFQFEPTTGSDWSCSAVINGLMMIFGGDEDFPYSNQISIVESCTLRRLGSLPMDFEFGACNTFQNPVGVEETLLCFSTFGQAACHR